MIFGVYHSYDNFIYILLIFNSLDTANNQKAYSQVSLTTVPNSLFINISFINKCCYPQLD